MPLLHAANQKRSSAIQWQVPFERSARPRRQEAQLIAARDLLLVAALPAMAVFSWVCPDSVCLSWSRAITRLMYRLRPRHYARFEQIYRDFSADSRPDVRHAQVVELAALLHLERLQLLRFYRPGGWQPRIEVAGEDHLEHALAQGKGAILWVASSTFSDIASKIALRQLGYSVWHLSRHTHGHLSLTRFGFRYINPIRIAVERRYLADRVVIDPDHPKAAVARLERLLEDNQVVSITVGTEARKVTLAPFGPVHVPLAGGAPNLAIKKEAALLPVFAERRPDGRFLVTIEAPLEAPDELSREQKINHMIASESALLYRYFRRLPSQCHCCGLHQAALQHEALARGVREGGGQAFGSPRP